ncbi:hypothetical protein EVAR_87559_1 [Eumeta japonica]|uniref:Uncharacterized protein n=1 Tax=Eumeta variegata TaxID=151549 RepID=A0A4C1XRA8_EUMVA|nr:hypothetical protein EVAR_87559_1 [Eumeta japonica]
MAMENEDGVTVLKWKDKRDVLMLSTKHSDKLLWWRALINYLTRPADSQEIIINERPKRLKHVLKLKEGKVRDTRRFSCNVIKIQYRNLVVIIMQPKIPFKPEPTGSRKKEEARLALFTAMHTSIRVVDHLGERNRMTLKLLTAILRVRCGLRLEGKCCNNYEVPVSVVKQIGTKESYQSDTDDDGADKTDSSEDELI